MISRSTAESSRLGEARAGRAGFPGGKLSVGHLHTLQLSWGGAPLSNGAGPCPPAAAHTRFASAAFAIRVTYTVTATVAASPSAYSAHCAGVRVPCPAPSAARLPASEPR